jgi:anti-sigma factor RsiW
MTEHLAPPILSALADGELSSEQLATTNQHLAECALCTSNALYQSLLKSATANAGRRYAPPPSLRERIVRQIRHDGSRRETSYRGISSLARRGFVFYGWAAAAALLLFCVGVVVIHQRTEIPSARVASENLGLANEAFDQHVATLAANAPPQVISSDRHTVKPWFQGKLPFSFNLPENLPSGTTLDGANLTYINDRPAAHLLYSIGKHRVSIYLEQGANSKDSTTPLTDHSGFHVIRFSTPEITGVAVSDVDPSRLSDLVRLIVQTQK